MPKQEYRVPMVENVVKVLDELAILKEATFTELMNNCELSKASTKRVLTTLMQQEVIEYNLSKRSYRLGMKVYHWGYVVSSSFDLRTIGRKELEKFRDETDETVFIIEKRRYQQVCVDKIESQERVRISTEIGAVLPLIYGAGRIILAFLEQEELDECLKEPIYHYTDHTIIEKQDIIAQLNEIRSKGYYFDNEEFIKGIVGLAVPLFNYTGKVIGGLCMVGIVQKIGSESKINEYVKKLIRAGNEISNQLGYQIT